MPDTTPMQARTIPPLFSTPDFSGQIVCPQRVENNARRKQGEFVRQPRTPRPVFELGQAATANDRLGIEFLQNQQKQKDAQLHAQERQIRESHPREWEALKRTYDTVRNRRQEKTAAKKESEGA